MFFSIKYSIIQKQYAHKLYNSKKHQQYYHSYHLSLVIIPLRITTLLLSYFLVSWFNTFRYHGLLIFSCSFDYLTGVYCHYLYLLKVAMSFCSEVLISIKSTRIIVGGYHGIRLYEREMQPHGVCRH